MEFHGDNGKLERRLVNENELWLIVVRHAGSVLSGAAVQPDTADVRAGRVQHVPARRGRAQSAGRVRAHWPRRHDVESARVRHFDRQIRGRHTHSFESSSQGLVINFGQINSCLKPFLKLF